MSKMIQIRNVPDEVHREARVRAARAGMTLSAYLLRQIERALEVPDIEELMERIRDRERIRASETSAEMIRAGREAR
jgi:plasmid stability protein